MKWYEVAMLLLGNDLLLFGLSTVLEKRKAKRLEEKLDDDIEIDPNTDWELEKQALEATLISEDEVMSMPFAQAVLLNEWTANRIEKEK